METGTAWNLHMENNNISFAKELLLFEEDWKE